MVDAVDCAILHGCDWDLHIEKARPFVEAGKAVLFDKPLAGSARDLHQIRLWAEAGARIIGGSSLRYCVETRDWLAQPEEERGTPHTVLAGCGTDDFNYGIHAYALLSGIMGPGAVSVQALGEHGQKRIRVTWADGRIGILTIGKAQGYLPFHASIVTGRTVTQFKTDSSKLYRAQLEVNLPYLAGETSSPFTPDTLLEPEMCAVAALKSWSHGNREIALAELAANDPGYDGAAFGVEYRKMRYPES
jgi:hypothetical protein